MPYFRTRLTRVKKNPIPKRIMTESLREYNREKKREERLRRSSQKKRRVKEYDRKRKTKATKEELQIAATMNGYTRYARIKATYRLKQKMPETPKKYAQVI